ncbi:MAG: DUF1398 domain-containing protein, partial [Armatimonadota bacterium]
MSKATQNLQSAMHHAQSVRTKVGGFPYLAEVLRQAGVTRNLWSLPSCQSVYVTDAGPVVVQGDPIISGMVDVPAFDSQALISALRTDQAGQGTFPEFPDRAWKA